MAYDGTLKFDTGIDTSGFEQGISGLGGIAQKGMAVVTNAVKAGTDAIVSFGKYSVEVGQNFESGMSQVIATMGITKDTVQDGVNSYELLKKAAADAGESTTFSATDAAGALNFLALAGYSAAQAADALPAVLNLAAAGGLDLQYASDLATDAMAALGIEASKDNLTHFGDQLAKTASKANASVAQLGEAILVVGGTAKSLAGGTTELNASLGVLANRGIKGAEGGTALRNMILSLTAPTDKAKEQLKALGVSALDADGNMRPMNETFKDLNAALAGMSDGQKTEILNNIFNKVDLKSANAMLAGCGEEFDALAAEIGNCDGAMSQMALTMNDTLKGDMKSLGSKAEALGIAVYDSLNKPLRELAQLGGEYLSKLTLAFKAGGAAGAARELGIIVGDAVKQLASYLPDIIRIGELFVKTLIKSIKSNAKTIAGSAIEIGAALTEGFFTLAADLLDLVAKLFIAFAEGFSERLPEIVTSAQEIITLFVSTITENISPVISAALGIISAICETLLNGENLQKLLDAGLEILMAVTQAIVDNLPVLVDVAIQLLTFFYNELLAPENILKLLEAGVQIVIALVDAIVDNLDELLIACEQIMMTLTGELIKPENLEKLLKLGFELLGKLIEGLCKVSGQLAGFAGDLFGEAWDTLTAMDWGSIGTAIVEGICSGLLGVDFKLDEFMDEFGDNWISGIKDIFGIHSPSKVMHDEVGAYLAEGIGEGFADRAANVAQGITQTVSGWADTLANAGKNAGRSYLDGAHKMLALLPDDLEKQLSDALSQAVKFGADLVQEGQNSAKEFLDIVIDFLAKLPDMTAAELQETLRRVIRWGGDLVKSGLQAAQELVTAITDTVSALPAAMAEVGRNLVSGLWNGITSMGSWLRDQIAGFAGGILDGFKDAFGIESPSKVMRDSVGKYIAQGVGAGFTAEIPDIGRNALRAFAEIELPEMQVPEIRAPEIEIPKIEIPEINAPEIRSPAMQQRAAVPAATPEALQMLRNAAPMPDLRPDAVQDITNHYTTYNNYSSGAKETQPVINVHVHVDTEMDGDRIAEKVAERVDILQGEAIRFDERGTAH